ncbi:hypothetical protein K8M07_08560 [Schnuerera sp. xch1]|uniref:hypothetical protein n=1 Tax=Schnuerera sp. xch1 TaxID=2874283 RepID=UPI001CBB4B61|nr:hypothetical protein [Schnuerera sp. xch1]MBZ2175298.1 hypothetical protein [Schnuerera sp. xch1]
MTYYKDKLSLISDSIDNIDLFRLLDYKIIRYHFDNRIQIYDEEVISTEVNSEFDVSIDEDDVIYLVYQNSELDLILTLINDREVEHIKLTRNPIPEVYYLNIYIYNGEPHIFYFILLSQKEKKYRLYHHYPCKDGWITNIIDEITVNQVLNSISIFNIGNDLLLAYYDVIEHEQIYIRIFDLEKKEWGEKVKLTSTEEDKLYLDFIYKDNKIHLTYCQYEEGNLVVRYERFDYSNGFMVKEVEDTISNPENPQYPTIIYYGEKLWIVWMEYDNVISRYSDDIGNIWSPIYLWNESKGNEIVRYKYYKVQNKSNTILNYSFGKLSQGIRFVGFGEIDDVSEIPVKKKNQMKFLKNLPKI